ncbi:hypothetical protein WN51_00853 [Melipona quadrifasciata]|uniref:Uncharacterized protein n=1 Tax=Melipona quadrifasciata TaxID=166423 RepID=A0A0M9AB49_9HYME|nr:hypothetical protein WN51_00853 [Melipona quadrifasciata]
MVLRVLIDESSTDQTTITRDYDRNSGKKIMLSCLISHYKISPERQIANRWFGGTDFAETDMKQTKFVKNRSQSISLSEIVLIKCRKLEEKLQCDKKRRDLKFYKHCVILTRVTCN